MRVPRLLSTQVIPQLVEKEPELASFVSARYCVSPAPYSYLEGVAVAYIALVEELKGWNIHPLRAHVSADGIDIYRRELVRNEIGNLYILEGKVNYYVPRLLKDVELWGAQLGYTDSDREQSLMGALDTALPFLHSTLIHDWHT